MNCFAVILNRELSELGEFNELGELKNELLRS
jgi:hypothetical protein